MANGNKNSWASCVTVTIFIPHRVLLPSSGGEGKKERVSLWLRLFSDQNIHFWFALKTGVNLCTIQMTAHRYNKVYKRHQTVCHRTICPGKSWSSFLILWCVCRCHAAFHPPRRSMWLSTLSEQWNVCIWRIWGLSLCLPTRVWRGPTLWLVHVMSRHVVFSDEWCRE